MDKLHYSTTVTAAIFCRDHAVTIHAKESTPKIFMDVDAAYEEFFNICAIMSIKVWLIVNDKEDMIRTFAARVEYLEVENRDLKEQIKHAKNILDEETEVQF